MVVKRKIDGAVHEFKLTESELYNAYREQEHIYDLDGVVGFFDCFEDGDLLDFCNMTRKQVEAKYEDIAYEMRRNIDKYNMLEEYALDEAVDYCLRQEKVV